MEQKEMFFGMGRTWVIGGLALIGGIALIILMVVNDTHINNMKVIIEMYTGMCLTILGIVVGGKTFEKIGQVFKKQ